MSTHVELRPGAYADSVTLLQVSRAVQGVEGVATAQVAMATPLNLEVLEQMGFTLPPSTANDMVVAIRLDDASALDAALAAVDTALTRTTSRADGGATREPHRTTGAALARPAPTRSCWSPCPGQARPSRRWTRSTPVTT
jgi:FdrA protein